MLELKDSINPVSVWKQNTLLNPDNVNQLTLNIFMHITVVSKNLRFKCTCSDVTTRNVSIYLQLLINSLCTFKHSICNFSCPRPCPYPIAYTYSLAIA